MIDPLALKEKARGIRVLFADDDPTIRTMMQAYLAKFFPDITMAENGQVALTLHEAHPFDLIITDILMPQMSGLQLIEAIRKTHPNQEFIISSAYSDFEYLEQAIDLGVTSYMLKPVEYGRIMRALAHALDNITLRRENHAYKTSLEAMLEEKIASYVALEQDKVDNYEKTLLSLVNMIEARDTYTAGHSQRVAMYAQKIGHAMGLDEKVCEHLYRAGIIHDIGKIATPDAVLLKPGKLTPLEFTLIKEHATVGYEVLKEIPMYAELSYTIKHHHEQYDGSGYPDGLKGEEIPLLARILTVADAFDAMTTNRIYKGRMTPQQAVNEMRSLAGKHFDPSIISYAQVALEDVTLDGLISQKPMTQIEHERFVYFYKDQVTDAYNKEYLDFVLASNRHEKKYTHATVIYLHNFSSYNGEHGWSNGDAFLISWCTYIHNLAPCSTIFRVHGDDFVMLHEEACEVVVDLISEAPLLKNLTIFATQTVIDLTQHNIDGFKDFERLMQVITPQKV